MPSIRVRQAGSGDTTATLTAEGLSAVQTLEKRQWDYLLSVYVKRQYHPVGKDLPAAMRSSLGQIASRARYDPRQRSAGGLPKWERGMVIIPAANWRRIMGGALVQVKNTGKVGHRPFDCYLPLLIDGGLDESRPIYLLVPPR